MCAAVTIASFVSQPVWAQGAPSQLPPVSTSAADTTPFVSAGPSRPIDIDAGDIFLDSIHAPQDTIRRPRAIHYSDWYGTRATIHRRLSYAMVPLFALSYYTGEKLFDEGHSATDAMRTLHQASATGVSVLFGVNAITGGINLWQSRSDPAMRKRRILHSVLFTAASGGFAYAGVVLADDARDNRNQRIAHRNVNLASMGVSIASALIMMVGPNR